MLVLNGRGICSNPLEMIYLSMGGQQISTTTKGTFNHWTHKVIVWETG